MQNNVYFYYTIVFYLEVKKVLKYKYIFYTKYTSIIYSIKSGEKNKLVFLMQNLEIVLYTIMVLNRSNCNGIVYIFIFISNKRNISLISSFILWILI